MIIPSWYGADMGLIWGHFEADMRPTRGRYGITSGRQGIETMLKIWFFVLINQSALTEA
tara:strand:+ start:209 stop:385 length:177 start_codon:yes stop_codon:yes gene_type:complete